MTLLAPFLFVAAANACDLSVHTDCDHDIHVVVDETAAEEDASDVEQGEPEREHESHSMFDDSAFNVQFTGTGLPSGGAYSLDGRLVGHRDAWVGGMGSWTTDGRWKGRVSAGLDIFGAKMIDLRVGLYVGHVGSWNSENNRYLSVGTELGTGFELGRLFFDYTVLGGRRPRGAGIRSEHIAAVGVRFFDELRLSVHWLGMHPGGGEQGEAGLGAGIAYAF